MVNLLSLIIISKIAVYPDSIILICEVHLVYDVNQNVVRCKCRIVNNLKKLFRYAEI